MLARVVSRLLNSAHRDGTGDLGFDAAQPLEQRWKKLVAEATRWQAEHLKIVLGDLRGEETWEHHADKVEGAGSNTTTLQQKWAVSFSFAAAGRRCQLSISGQDGGVSQPWRHLQLARIAQNFGQQWLREVATPKWAEDPTPAPVFLNADGIQPARRAA
jgi:hypothetical protein